jgi:hypothetical protein
MTARPELWQSIGIVVCPAVLGLLSGIRMPSEIFKNGSCSRRTSSDFIVSASSALYWRGGGLDRFPLVVSFRARRR